jgi:hypothetical protein
MQNCNSSFSNNYCESSNENCIVRTNYKPQHTRFQIDAFTIPIVVRGLSPEQIKYWQPVFTYEKITKPETPLPWWKY